MVDVERSLRQVSDDLLADLAKLQELEETKRQIPPDDERLVGLAVAIERLAVRVLRSSRDESQIVQAAAVMVQIDDPGAPVNSIEETPRLMRDILSEWRMAEQELSAAPEGSDDAAKATAKTATLRAEYQRACDFAKSKVNERPA
ncbi:MAG: hypothetical protein ABIZ34_09110 [Candidatus Limnocylindrales bacterium]